MSRIEEIIEKLRNGKGEFDDKDLFWLISRVEAAEKLAETLRFYANHESWQSTTHEHTFDGMPCDEFDQFKSPFHGPYQVAGRKARKALEEWKRDK